MNDLVQVERKAQILTMKGMKMFIEDSLPESHQPGDTVTQTAVKNFLKRVVYLESIVSEAFHNFGTSLGVSRPPTLLLPFKFLIGAFSREKLKVPPEFEFSLFFGSNQEICLTDHRPDFSLQFFFLHSIPVGTDFHD